MRVAVALALLAACGPRTASVEDGEWLPGDVTTNTLLLGSDAFMRPANTLTAEQESRFFAGNSFFNDHWVEAPASTANRDGLGPLFNARACAACHFKDGRAAPPGPDGFGVGLLFRVSGPDGLPLPGYGDQLQDVALPGLRPEVRIEIRWTERAGTFADGDRYHLLEPQYSFADLAYGPFPDGVQISPRIGPQMIGLGLLEAIPADAIEALADPEDRDGDGVRGRPQRVLDPETGTWRLGRFGWKGDAATVLHQAAAAFHGDMGLTTALLPDPPCAPLQADCLGAPDGGSPEIEPHILDRVTLYSRALAVPVREGWDDPEVLRGKHLFRQLGCARCHTPSHTTGPFPALPAFEGLTIWPYTDLLLHDMGPDLADGRPLGQAGGQDWRTPPLWGLGRVPDVNGHDRYLHDGRARGLEEAVLWHGGEAEPAREAYTAMDRADRAALIAFVASL